jgi:hypothetical protein
MAKMEDAAIELIKHGANPRMLAKNGTSIMDLYPSLSPQFPERVKSTSKTRDINRIDTTTTN